MSTYKCQHEAFVIKKRTWMTTGKNMVDKSNLFSIRLKLWTKQCNDWLKPPYAGVCPNAVDPVAFCGATTHTERSHKNLNLKDFHITLIMMLMILSSNDNNDNDLFVCQGLADGEPEMDFSGFSFHPFSWTRHQSNLVQHTLFSELIFIVYNSRIYLKQPRSRRTYVVYITHNYCSSWEK